jgi:hypothetical protein
MVRMVAAAPSKSHHLNNDKPDFTLTEYGLKVARAIPTDLPDEPTYPILLDIESGTLINPPKPAARPAAEALLADGGFTESVLRALLGDSFHAPEIATAPEDAPNPAAAPIEDDCPTDPHACDLCPVKAELELLYTLFPSLRATVAPIIALRNAMERQS